MRKQRIKIGVGQKLNEKNVKIKETFDKLYLNEKQLTAGQLQFIDGCKKHFKRYGELSEKQITVLNDIRKYLPAQDIRFSGSVEDNENARRVQSRRQHNNIKNYNSNT